MTETSTEQLQRFFQIRVAEPLAEPVVRARQRTAVRSADSDARPTPPFPEYISAHAAACAASFGVLDATFEGNVSFTMETTTAPPDMPTRTFASFRAAAEECADSRVRLGWHFRYSTDAGLTLGRRVARYTLNHALKSLRGGDGSEEKGSH